MKRVVDTSSDRAQELMKGKERKKREKGWIFVGVVICIGFIYLIKYIGNLDGGGVSNKGFPQKLQGLDEVGVGGGPEVDGGQGSQEVVSNKSLGFGDDDAFQIKHVFHHGAGSNSYKVHRRLDITLEFLNKHPEMFKGEIEGDYIVSDEKNLDQVLAAYDWPKAHRGKDPWRMKHRVRKGRDGGQALRLQERHQPNFLESYMDYAASVRGNPRVLNRIHLKWVEEKISIPDVKDKESVLSLAAMSSNAYVKLPRDEKDKKKLDWIDVGEPWRPDDTHKDVNFGWQDDGLRGHVFVSSDNKTVVIAIKGTSGAGLPGGGPQDTAEQDKVNDNLLFLCCCARISYMWTTVCDCYKKAYTCDQDCLEREHMRKDRYYQAALDIYRNVTAIYPPKSTDIWVTGHSLGGALASLLGRTFGLPAVAFESPGEMLATKRLHLPQPPGLPRHMENIWHFGNTGDPIFMGVCNGISSSCNAAGYALETSCHTGKQCIYDVVTDKGWHVNLLNHRIHTLIDDIIMEYNETAPCEFPPPCKDCFNWRYISDDAS